MRPCGDRWFFRSRKNFAVECTGGFETPNAGSVRRCFAGVNRRTDRLTHSGLPLYWVPQNGGLWPHLTVQQHLEAVQKNAEVIQTKS